MVLDPAASASFPCSIAPWLSVRNSARAIDFYKSAFGATEVFRLEDPGGGVVARLSIDGAEFWLSDESPERGNFIPQSLGGGSVRMILTVSDPAAVFLRAIKGGASEVSRSEKKMVGDWGVSLIHLGTTGKLGASSGPKLMFGSLLFG